MTSAPNLPSESKADKQLIGGYASDEERRIVSLAAVEDDLTRSKFIVAAAVEKAVGVLRERNPSALAGTSYEVSEVASRGA